MTIDILIPSLLKIERAKKHVLELQREVDGYLAQYPAKLMIRDDLATGESLRFIKQEVPVPPDVGLIIGDAIHNLRTALDLVIFAIVGDKTNAPQQVQFPWAWAAKKLDATIATRQVGLAGKNVIDVVKGLQPYPGGNPTIEAVHILDITDKHKLILTTTRSVSLTVDDFKKFVPIQLPALEPGKSVSFVLSDQTRFNIVHRFVGETRAERRARRKSPPREYEADLQPPFQICFGNGSLLEGHPVMEFMPLLVNEIGDACRSIADAHVRDLAS